MKNARQVCLCKNVGELQFSDLHGTVVVGKTIYQLKMAMNIKFMIICAPKTLGHFIVPHYVHCKFCDILFYH